MNWNCALKIRLWAYVGVAALLASPVAHAAHFFRDDFEDGSLTDGEPVSWFAYPAPYNLGTFDVGGGDMVITPFHQGPALNNNNYREKDVAIADRRFHDVSVHLRARALASGPSVIGIGLLDTHFTDSGLGVSTNAALVFDGFRRYLNLNRDLNNSFTLIRQANTPIDQYLTDVHLRFVVEGTDVRFKAWPDGSPEPKRPQIIATLPSTYGDVRGQVALFAGGTNTSVPVAFRFVEVVPEPSVLSLAGIAAVFLLGRRQHRQ